MKRWMMPAVALLGLLPALGQTQVDRLVAKLDDLALNRIDAWKVSPDIAAAGLSGDGYALPEFNDAAWRTLSLDERLPFDSCWVRRTIVLPRFISGEPVKGSVRLALTADDYGFVWVNGQSRGRFNWDGEIELTPEAKPGDRFVVAVKVVNTGGPLRLIKAGLRFSTPSVLASTLEDFALSLRVGQKLLGNDTYQTSSHNKVDPGTDKSSVDSAEKRRLMELLQGAAARVDTAALERGDIEAFKKTLALARAELAPVGEFARQFTLHFSANAHIDAAWLWREKETVQVCNNTFSSVMNMFRARPDFTYTQSSAAYYDWIERLYPALFRDIKQRVREGRWEVIGGMWIEPDCNLPSGDSWARQLLYAKRYFRDKLGAEVALGWNPDSFGYNWNMPQFYRLAGIEAFITQKIGWNDTNVFPHRLFWWEAPDGSRVLSLFPFDYVQTVEDPFRLVDWMRQFEANTGFRRLMILFGVGDHGGGPSLEMIDRIEKLKTLDIYPSIQYGTAKAYVDWLKTQPLEGLPVWRDELYLEYHQGTFTTQAQAKEENRRGEALLTGAEAFAALAARLAGKSYPAADLETAWKHLLFNQFHDILPGSSIRPVYFDAAERYREVRSLGGFHLQQSLAALAGEADTSRVKKGQPLVVFNPLAWERREVARFTLPEGAKETWAVFDAEGREVPSQVVRTGTLSRELLFIADRVPSLGFAVFELREQSPGKAETDLAVKDQVIENAAFRVELDPLTGWVRSIRDKKQAREVLAGPGNELQVLEDRPSAWDAWNIGLTGVAYPSNFRKLEVVERGPVRAVLRAHRDYLKPGVRKEYPTEDFPNSFFTQDIVLYAGADRIDFSTAVDWWEDKTMLKVAFPVAVETGAASFEIPFGSIRRSTGMNDSWERAKVEVPAQRWADLSQDDYGVSLLNDSKYGYDVKGNTLRLSLLRSPLWPDPTADRGRHSIRYALYPHPGRWEEALTFRRGAEFNAPLLVTAASIHKGKLPARHSLLGVGPENFAISSLKQAEGSAAWVVTLYDAAGRGGTATITLPFNPSRAVLSDFLEQDGAALTVQGNQVSVPIRKNAVGVVKIF